MQIRYILFFLIIGTYLFSIEYDLGEIEVIDKRESFYESENQIEAFVKIVRINDEDYSKTIKEILENNAGVILKDSGGEAGFKSISIRGSSPENVLILIDGIPINSSGGNSVDLNIINLSLIDRIEIIKGGDSSLYGSNACGGVINIVTKKFNKDKRYFHFTFSPYSLIKCGIGINFNKNYFNFFIANSITYDKGDFIFLNNNGTIYNKEDDFYDKRENNSLFSIGTLINSKIDLKEKSFLIITLNNNLNNNGVAGPKNFIPFFKNAFYQRDLLVLNTLYNSGNLNKYINFEIKGGYKFDYYNYTNPEDTSNIKNILSYLNYFDLSLKLIFTEIPYNLLIIENSLNFEILSNNSFNFIPYRITGNILIRDEIIFYNDKIGIIPSVRLSFANDNYFYPSFNLGFFYNQHKYFKFKTNIYGAYRNPDFFELYYSYGFTQGNKDLKPEKSFGFDTGFIIDTKGFFLELIGFFTSYIDLIKYILSYGYIYRPINFSYVISYGFESSFIFNPVKIFKLEINYTLNFLNDIDMLKLGLFYQLPGQPLHSASFILEFLIDFFTLGFKVKIEDKIYINNIKYIEPKTIIDIYLKFNFLQKIGIFLFLNNITNIYREDIRNYPLEGFNFKMGVNIEI